MTNKNNNNALTERSRKFCLSSYIDPVYIERFVISQPWVQHWAYCFHDKDINEDGSIKTPHTHILLYTYEAKTATAVKKIFDRYSKEVYACENEIPQNTNTQVMCDVWHMWRYLIHKDNPEKYQYDEVERKCDDYFYWSKMERNHGFNQSDSNTGASMIEDMMNGSTTRSMVEKYGKEYIYHASHLKNCMYDIIREETFNHKDPDLDITELFPTLLEKSTFDEQTKQCFYMVLSYIKSECLLTYKSHINFYLEDEKE